MASLIKREAVSQLAYYARVPCAFQVASRIDLAALSRGRLTATAESMPFEKDYDAIPENAPPRWAPRLSNTSAVLIAVFEQEERIAGAVVACDSATADLLSGDPKDAVLWDLRVAPGARHRGWGRILVREAERWAVAQGSGWLKAETQDINVAACGLYEHCGFTVASITPAAYPALPDEARIVWAKRLHPDRPTPTA